MSRKSQSVKSWDSVVLIEDIALAIDKNSHPLPWGAYHASICRFRFAKVSHESFATERVPHVGLDPEARTRWRIISLLAAFALEGCGRSESLLKENIALVGVGHPVKFLW